MTPQFFFFVEEGEGEQCPHCKSWFTTKSVLSLHMRERHNDRNVNEITAMNLYC